MYLDGDIFDVLYNEGNNNNLDIVKFNGIQVRGINNFFKNNLKRIHLSNHTNNIVIFQPELSYYILKRIDDNGNYTSTDVYMWLKCITVVNTFMSRVFFLTFLTKIRGRHDCGQRLLF